MQRLPTLIVHGGAGLVDLDRLPRCLAACAAAAGAGYAILDGGGAALDAVEAAVRALEDDPDFNAGYGAVLNRAGDVEVDAAIMDGTLRAGAVGALPFVRHPIAVARRLLEEESHVLLVGAGALAYAREQGIEPEPRESFITARAQARWERERQGQLAPSATGDTVGACAIDRQGRLAAATSTGGISWKRPGRVGDSPLLGCGLYADDELGAASATGHGESIMRLVMARGATEQLRQGGGAAAAAQHAVDDLGRRLRALGGIILVDRDGGFGHARNTSAMPWAAVRAGEADRGS